MKNASTLFLSLISVIVPLTGNTISTIFTADVLCHVRKFLYCSDYCFIIFIPLSFQILVGQGLVNTKDTKKPTSRIAAKATEDL
ncbi:hypothetical protein EVAR_25011_1 [Eumeta japonica]|uniref:Uncharacterized protein n=1 Tax=Eumeta variegata TaxID=151549 RepID=A0A4C1V797_EUMVA|nr:hypothetical protein EVAR_25011_1 [Eumeta japonica]